MGRSPCCAKEGLNKGAWTVMEDKILTDYIKLHGDGKWRNLPIKAGLKRCGKSCRLRWLNYLKPDVKRGNISRDEEDLIIRLHNLLGNRWSLIAGRLPGRTDNEIKNYWNTNIGKRITSALTNNTDPADHDDDNNNNHHPNKSQNDHHRKKKKMKKKIEDVLLQQQKKTKKIGGDSSSQLEPAANEQDDNNNIITDEYDHSSNTHGQFITDTLQNPHSDNDFIMDIDISDEFLTTFMDTTNGNDYKIFTDDENKTSNDIAMQFHHQLSYDDDGLFFNKENDDDDIIMMMQAAADASHLDDDNNNWFASEFPWC